MSNNVFFPAGEINHRDIGGEARWFDIQPISVVVGDGSCSTCMKLLLDLGSLNQVGMSPEVEFCYLPYGRQGRGRVNRRRGR